MNVYVLYHEYILLIVIGMARLLPITFFLPWFNSQVLGGMLAKNVITCFMLLGFLPLLSVQFPLASAAAPMVIIVREAIIGLLCGICLSVPFWIALVVGEVIDNQRGATISSTMNPGIGVETSVFASFMNYFYGATFMLSGGMVTLCEAIKKSYQIFPVAQSFHFDKALALQVVHLVNAEGFNFGRAYRRRFICHRMRAWFTFTFRITIECFFCRINVKECYRHFGSVDLFNTITYHPVGRITTE